MAAQKIMKTIVAVLFASITAACSNQAVAESHIVEMRGLEFFPASLEVAVGDTITWINKDVMPHTATAGDGSWDSGLMEKGDEFSLEIEASTSTGEYVCNFHPTM
ncbi:MAG: hypothetical protein GXP04_00630, partial [Alphaproteobacteria bacterium]|nr:hypothetical protein [Alphaproteobacteria bacterium]